MTTETLGGVSESATLKNITEGIRLLKDNDKKLGQAIISLRVANGNLDDFDANTLSKTEQPDHNLLLNIVQSGKKLVLGLSLKRQGIIEDVHLIASQSESNFNDYKEYVLKEFKGDNKSAFYTNVGMSDGSTELEESYGAHLEFFGIGKEQRVLLWESEEAEDMPNERIRQVYNIVHNQISGKSFSQL